MYKKIFAFVCLLTFSQNPSLSAMTFDNSAGLAIEKIEYQAREQLEKEADTLSINLKTLPLFDHITYTLEADEKHLDRLDFFYIIDGEPVKVENGVFGLTEGDLEDIKNNNFVVQKTNHHDKHWHKYDIKNTPHFGWHPGEHEEAYTYGDVDVQCILLGITNERYTFQLRINILKHLKKN